MQHEQGPTARSWESRPSGRGGKGAGAGRPAGASHEEHEYDERQPTEMAHPGILLQSEHEYARARSDTRDVMVTDENFPAMPVDTIGKSPENTHETMPTCARVTRN